MKTILLSALLSGIIILSNCSGERSVVDPPAPDDDIMISLNMTEDPGPQYPPEYGDNEFTLPYMIIMSYNIPIDTCGPYCEIMVGAYLLDYYARSYSIPGIEINFEVIPDSLAVISHTTYTNEDGWAAAKLVYPTSNAFEEVVLVATCGPVADTSTIILPICNPYFELSADPERLWVEQPGDFDTTSIACRLSDGLGNYIGGGRIVFVALVAGQICGPTSVYTDEQGWAYTHYRIRYEEIPDGNSDPNILETGVRVALFGYPDADAEIGIFCTRP